MADETKEKWAYYSHLIAEGIKQVMLDNNILEELAEDEGNNYKHFLHALATGAPSYIYNSLSNTEVSQLEFNHIANELCFQFVKLIDSEK